MGGEAAAIGDRDEIALVGAPKSTNGCLISVTHWAETSAAQQSDENKAYVATRSKADGGIDMPGILTAVPFFNEKIAGMHVASWKEQNYLVGGESRPKQNSTIRVIFWAGKKICMFEISCPAATNSATAARKNSVCSPEVTLLWTDVRFLHYCVFAFTNHVSLYSRTGYRESSSVLRSIVGLAHRFRSYFFWPRRCHGFGKSYDRAAK